MQGSELVVLDYCGGVGHLGNISTAALCSDLCRLVGVSGVVED